MRAGTGFDAHRLTEGRELILGGVKIPYEKGLLGHSDADVLTHAVMDALLGACGAPDIGVLFPDTDPALLGISSIELLKKTGSIIRERGYTVCNIDSVIIAQKPRLSPYIGEMRRIMAEALCIGEDRINIKATTTEGMGFTGNGEGIAAQSVCLLTETEDRS